MSKNEYASVNDAHEFMSGILDKCVSLDKTKISVRDVYDDSDESTQQLVDSIITGTYDSLDVPGDINVFVENVKKYGARGLRMPC